MNVPKAVGVWVSRPAAPRVRLSWSPVFVPVAVGVFWGAWTKVGFWWALAIASGWPTWMAYRLTRWLVSS